MNVFDDGQDFVFITDNLIFINGYPERGATTNPANVIYIIDKDNILGESFCIYFTAYIYIDNGKEKYLMKRIDNKQAISEYCF